MERPGGLVAVAAGVVTITLLMAGSSAGRPAAGRAGPSDVVINEVEYDPLQDGNDNPWEWIELYNNTDQPVDVTDWTIQDDDYHRWIPALTIPAGGHAVVAASTYFYDNYPDFEGSIVFLEVSIGGGLRALGDRLYLRDTEWVLIDAVSYGDDTTVLDCTGYPCAGVAPGHSLERQPPGQDSDGPGDFVDRFPPTPGGAPPAPPPYADLEVAKHGPASILPGEAITYTVALSNSGPAAAHSVRLTDVLPAAVGFLTHSAPYTFSQPLSGTLVWELGTLQPVTISPAVTFSVAGRVASDASGWLTNAITATTTSDEADLDDNHDRAVTLAGSGPAEAVVLIEALYPNGDAAYDYDEAVRLMNVGGLPAAIGGWRLAAGLSRAEAVFPPGSSLAPGQAAWCARRAADFYQQFGFKPDFETDGSDPTVAQMEGAWPRFADEGSQCLLLDAGGGVVDAVVYGNGDTALPGWDGPAVQPWTPTSHFRLEGQILYRKRDQLSGRPLPDSDTAADWAQDPADHVDGRRVQYPGWDLDRFFWTAGVTETAVLTVAIGPDHLLEAVLAQVAAAQDSIAMEAYTFDSGPLAQALLERLAAGVEVTLLLESGPAGGASEAQRWICGQIEDAGGQVYFMRTADAHRRYRQLHAKFLLIDERLALAGSENPGPSGMPADDKADGTAGQRGVYLMTDAPGVVAHLRAVLDADLDVADHGDLVTCATAPELCAGTPPPAEPNWLSYTVAFSTPLTVEGEFSFELVQSPENSLRTAGGLLGLVGRAGSGDTVLTEQLYEQVHWGPTEGTPADDPNPRLEAYLEAARRGAAVRILLNGYPFAPEAGGNAETVEYLRSVARREGLDLQVRLGNPTRLGLHNKMVLARIGGQGYVHVGSINGSEVSSKVNRELALQVRSDAAYDYLRALFEHDWRNSPLTVYLPLVLKDYGTPRPANHLLIGEVFYAVSKEGEWLEILNPTDAPIDMSSYKVGDAERADAYEGMYEFPPGTELTSHGVLVVASSGAAFRQAYGRPPDWEFYETDPSVPNLAPAGDWGEGEWELSKDGDEVLLLDGFYQAVDVVVYGLGSYHEVVPHPGVEHFSHSLERYPAWFDTDDCSYDFRDWPFPNPGELP